MTININAMKYILSTFAFITVMFFSQLSVAQEALKPRPSPMYVATVKYEDSVKNKSTYVKVTYCRPHLRGRTPFTSDFVPYGQVWRTGANEATEITFTNDVKVARHKIKAGTYTIFTIPEKDKWTVIFNSELGQWGAYSYDPSKNILEIEAKAGETDVFYEPFTIEFQLNDNVADMVFMWGNVKASFPIEFK